MNLFIADTQSRAEILADDLNLDRREWLVTGIGGALCGHKFNKIVDVSHDISPTSVEWLKHAYSKKVREPKKRG